MSATATEVINAIEALLKLITPTVDGGAKRFVPMPDARLETQGRPTDRLFSIVFGAGFHGEAPEHPTDANTWTTVQDLRLTIAYAIDGQRTHGLNALRRKIRSDVRDIAAAIDLGTNWLANNTERQQVTGWGEPYPDATQAVLLQDITIRVAFFESSAPAA